MPMRRAAALLAAAGLLLAGLVFALQQRPAQAAPSSAEGGMCPRDTAGTIYLEIKGIEGESKDEQHPGWLELESYSWGMTQTGTVGGGGGGGAGKVSMQDFHFTMKMDKASPKLMQACALGEHLREVKLDVRRPNAPESFLQWTMEDVVCSSYQTGNNAHGDALPTEQVSLNFGKIKVSYTEQDKQCKPGDTTKFQWDVERNEVF
ncbi:MAG: type VI secretion system tube protein Hcp [bacterium]|nr:type VI secretion system tube protein Hcp [bacterium]